MSRPVDRADFTQLGNVGFCPPSSPSRRKPTTDSRPSATPPVAVIMGTHVERSRQMFHVGSTPQRMSCSAVITRHADSLPRRPDIRQGRPSAVQSDTVSSASASTTIVPHRSVRRTRAPVSA